MPTTHTLTTTEAALAATYAAKTGCTPEEAAAIVVDMREAIAKQAATATGEVVRWKNCPECGVQSQVDIDVDWSTKVGRKVDGCWACPECGTDSIWESISLKTGEAPR